MTMVISVGERMRRIRYMSGVAIACALVVVALSALSACTSAPPRNTPPVSHPEESMDTGILVAQLETIPGVDGADVAVAVNGLPGHYLATTTVAANAEGNAELGRVLSQAASFAWTAYGAQVTDYSFQAKEPSEAGSTGYRMIYLEDRKAELPFLVGSYLGRSVAFTADELAMATGAARTAAEPPNQDRKPCPGWTS